MISGCETVDSIGAMFVHPADKIVGHANVQGSMFAAGHEINVVHNTDHLGLWIPGSGLRPAPE